MYVYCIHVTISVLAHDIYVYVIYINITQCFKYIHMRSTDMLCVALKFKVYVKVTCLTDTAVMNASKVVVVG